MPDEPLSSSGSPRRKRRGFALGALIVGALVLVFAALAIFVLPQGWLFGEPETMPPTHEGEGGPPEGLAEFFPDGSAAENLPFFLHTLEEFAGSDAPIEGATVVEAVETAGFKRQSMQVSFDRTQTNLVADSIFISVRIDADCLVGQLVTETREAVAMTAPAVGPNQDICLIGNTAPIG